jgi:hypothetical protein
LFEVLSLEDICVGFSISQHITEMKLTLAGKLWLEVGESIKIIEMSMSSSPIKFRQIERDSRNYDHPFTHRTAAFGQLALHLLPSTEVEHRLPRT